MNAPNVLPRGDEKIPNAKPDAEVMSLSDLQPANPDDGTTLLGNRFLCRGGGLLFVGQSGIGKSTCLMQMAIAWSIGRECFGIKPSRPLSVLMVQAENDAGDLCEMRDGIFAGMNLSSKDKTIIGENFHVVFEASRCAAELMNDTIAPLLAKYAPDLLIIDPALSYLGGDANSQKDVGGFLRNQLNPAIQKAGCGVVVIHHTTKPKAGTQPEKLSSDSSYAGAGSAEFSNWARGVLVLSAKDDHGLRELRIGKRFRLGWKDETGQSISYRMIRQNTEGGGLFYTELSESERMVCDKKTSPMNRVLFSGVLPVEGESIAKKTLVARITGDGLCGEKVALSQVIPLLIDEGYLLNEERPRHGTRPEVWLTRTSKIPGFVSFVSQ